MSFKELLRPHLPAIRGFAWRYIRTFLAAFIVTFASLVELVDGKQLLGDSLSVGFVPFLGRLWEMTLYPALLAGIIAGISATMKLAREMFGSGDGSTKIEKIPL